jgi:hypothetical protein
MSARVGASVRSFGAFEVAAFLDQESEIASAGGISAFVRTAPGGLRAFKVSASLE